MFYPLEVFLIKNNSEKNMKNNNNEVTKPYDLYNNIR